MDVRIEGLGLSGLAGERKESWLGTDMHGGTILGRIRERCILLHLVRQRAIRSWLGWLFHAKIQRGGLD